jgi:hypothetical protein
MHQSIVLSYYLVIYLFLGYFLELHYLSSMHMGHLGKSYQINPLVHMNDCKHSVQSTCLVSSDV